MIKLLRTHPRHLAGTQISSRSPRLSKPGPHDTPSFGKILQKALHTVTGSLPSGRKAKPLLKDFFAPLLPFRDAHQYPSIPPTLPPPKTAPTSKGNPVFGPPNGPGDFEALIDEASRKFGVGKNIIRSVIKAESDFNSKAKSHAGAVGLMQLLPSTATELGVTDPYDPRENILGGTRYLAMLLDRYEGDLRLTLAAYNWGPGNLERAPDRLPRETENYVEKVLSYLETLAV